MVRKPASILHFANIDVIFTMPLKTVGIDSPPGTSSYIWLPRSWSNHGPPICANRYLTRFWEPPASRIFNQILVNRVLSLRLHDFDFPRACSHYSHDPADTLAAHSAAHRKNHSAHKLLTAWRKLSVVDPVDD